MKWIHTAGLTLCYLSLCEWARSKENLTPTEPTFCIASLYLQISVYTGSIAGYTSLSFTNFFTSLTTNGLVSLFSPLNCIPLIVHRSPNTICIACLPSGGRLSSVGPLSPIHIPFPPPSLAIPRPVCRCEFLDYLRELQLIYSLMRQC
jgi:hypothetical protein